VTRLEHRLNRLEEHHAVADTEHAHREIAHARDSIGQPFPHATELTAAKERTQQIDEALERMARPEQHNDAPDAAQAPQPAKAADERDTEADADSRRPAGGPSNLLLAEPDTQHPGPAVNERSAPISSRDPGGTPANEPLAPVPTAQPPTLQPPTSLSAHEPETTAYQTPPQSAAISLGPVSRTVQSGHFSAPRINDHSPPQPAGHLDTAQPPNRSPQAIPPSATAILQANRAAVAANEAYRAGDLDQARQLTDHAAALDPGRAGLWQQHRTEIEAKRLFLAAREAHAEGDPTQAHKLIDDARQLDPRMQTVWNQHNLPGTSTSRATHAARGHESSPGTSAQPSHKDAVRIRAEPSEPGTPPSAPAVPVRGPGATARTTLQCAAEPSLKPIHSAIREPSGRQATGWQPRPIRPGRVSSDEPSSKAPPDAPEASHDDTSPASGTPTAPPRHGGLPSPTTTNQAQTADWRDTVIETGRQAWQPRVVQPYTPYPSPPQANGPEIGS
jgi:hypothetical protein